MNFMDTSITVPAERSEENPGSYSGMALKEIRSHSQLEQMRVILYARRSGFAAKQVGMVSGAFRKASGTFEPHIRQRREERKEYWKRQGVLDRQANDLMDMGILIGEVYDDKIIEEMLAQGAESYAG